MDRIKNVNGTSKRSSKCNCGSWIDHWNNFSKYKEPNYCVIDGCINKIADGAHVQVSSSDDDNWYILPMCHYHNVQKNREFKTPYKFLLVSANQSETCG